MLAPKSGDSLRVDQFEDSFVGIGPFNVARTDFPVLQQLHQELPQVQRVSSWNKKTGRKNLFIKYGVKITDLWSSRPFSELKPLVCCLLKAILDFKAERLEGFSIDLKILCDSLK